MYKKVKHYLASFKENNHTPQSLRNTSIKILLGIVIVIELCLVFFMSPFFGDKYEYLAAVLPAALVGAANKTRVEANVGSLVENDLLKEAAQLKANDMATREYFSHKTPEGEDPWIFLEKAGYKYLSAGENLAINFSDSKKVHNAWMNSSTHRANILQPKFTEIGIATAEGRYKGKKAMFVVQFFGKPNLSN